MQSHYVLTRAEYERELDTTLDGSFPASDPPPWTLGASPWMDVEDPGHRECHLMAERQQLID